MTKRKQMMTAGLVGVGTTAADMGVLVLLVELLAMAVPAAAFLAASFGAVLNFTLNKYVSFRDRSPIRLPQVLRFALVAIGTSLLMALGMKLIAVELGVPYLLARAICGASVFVLWTYPAQRRLVFARLVHA